MEEEKCKQEDRSVVGGLLVMGIIVGLIMMGVYVIQGQTTVLREVGRRDDESFGGE